MGLPSDSLHSDRYKSWARHASDRNIHTPGAGEPAWGEGILPTYSQEANAPSSKKQGSGNFDEKAGLNPSVSASSNGGKERNGKGVRTATGELGGSGNGTAPQASTLNTNVADVTTSADPPAAPPPVKSEAARSGDSALDPPADGQDAAGAPKRPMTTRMKDGSKRFYQHFKDALFHSWVNILLVFVPIGIASDAAGLGAGITFATNAIAIIPLAGMLAHATEAVASRLGDTWGALLNVSFGNAVELIIFIIALVKDEIDITQAALLGSILANLLLILGMAFLIGGLRYQEQLYNNTVTQMSACLLSLSVVSLLLPTAFHASFKVDNTNAANSQVLKVSRGTSVVLLIVYFLYLLFQLKSHTYLYESTPQAIIDEESHPGVFADIMNSSSSSDSSSSDDSSDTDGSMSVHNAGKKIKRAFNRRRKSSASTSSAATSAKVSVPSSSSAKEPHNGSSTDQSASLDRSARESGSAALGGNPEDGDADTDEEHVPRVRDFVRQQIPGTDANASRRKKQKKKHHKKHHKKSRRGKATDENDSAVVDDDNVAESPMEMTQEPAEMSPAPRVNFAEEVEQSTQPSRAPPRSSFNRRQLGKATSFRPALPKMLSQNVFVNQPPTQQQAVSMASRPMPARTQSSSAAIRRTSSLPERLHDQYEQPYRPGAYRTDALPPFHHQTARQQMSGSSGHHNATVAAADAQSPAKDEDEPMSRTAAVVLLLCSTGLVAVCAEFMVDAIPAMLKTSNVSQAFIGLIILPIVSNAAEHVTAVTVAAKNKMDLAIGVAVGSSIQISLLVTPLVVLLGWILDKDMSLYFNLFDTISLFVTAFVVNFLVLDGRSNYLEGSLLIAAYVIIGLGAYFYPSQDQTSSIGAGQ